MSPSIWYWSLIYVGNCFECILIYSALDIVFSKKKYFRSQDINIAPRRASEIVLFKSSFYSKRDASGDDSSSGYSILSPLTINLTLYGSGFSGW